MPASRKATTLLVCLVTTLSHAQIPPSDSKVRVYVADSQSWESTGGWGFSNGSGGGQVRGGARPQTAEIIKTFNERCPAVTVTNAKDRANFAVVLDHEGGKGILAHRNKVAVFNREGDVVYSGSTRSIGTSVKDACEAIAMAPNSALPPPVSVSSASPASSPSPATPAPTPSAQVETARITPVNTVAGPTPPVSPRVEPIQARTPTPVTPVPARAEPVRIIPTTKPAAIAPSKPLPTVQITFASNPPGALVTCNGTRFGQTPFVIPMLPGTYPVKFTLAGFPDWDAEITVEEAKPSTLVAQLNSTTGVWLK